jgi:hypothetical protein
MSRSVLVLLAVAAAVAVTLAVLFWPDDSSNEAFTGAPSAPQPALRSTRDGGHPWHPHFNRMGLRRKAAE